MSCKSKQKLLETDQIIPLDSVYQEIFTPSEIDWFVGRAKVKISNDETSESFVMYLRMKSDSVIWASFKKYLQEGGRALIDKDSVSIINRLDKTYQVISLKELSNRFGMTPHLNDIQALIKAQIPNIDTTHLWQSNQDEAFYNFRSIKDDIVYEFSYDKKLGKLKKGHFIDRFNLNGYWDYDDYRIVDNIAVPFFRKYRAEFGPDNYLNVTLEFTDIELNKANTTNFRIPSHYKKMH